MNKILNNKHSKAMDGYTNELTEEIDNNLIDAWKGKNFCTYFVIEYIDDKAKDIPFRFPGATRGGIKVDEDGIILKIIFDYFNGYEGPGSCYKKEVQEAVKKYIGYRIW
jgi:hypothetical protein